MGTKKKSTEWIPGAWSLRKQLLCESVTSVCYARSRVLLLEVVAHTGLDLVIQCIDLLEAVTGISAEAAVEFVDPF